MMLNRRQWALAFALAPAVCCLSSHSIDTVYTSHVQ